MEKLSSAASEQWFIKHWWLRKYLNLKGYAEVINMHTIKPLDYQKIDGLIKIKKPIVTIEEHAVVGGWVPQFENIFRTKTKSYVKNNWT